MATITRSRPPAGPDIRRQLLLRQPPPITTGKPVVRKRVEPVQPQVRIIVKEVPPIPPQRSVTSSGASPHAVPWQGLKDLTYSGNRIVDMRDIVAYPDTPADLMHTEDGSTVTAVRFLDPLGNPVAMGVEGLPGPPGMPGSPGPPGPPGEDGDVPEAPEDGQQYAREDGAWTVVEPGASDWADITGKPATFPPTIPSGGGIAAWPYLPLTGGTLTGALTGTSATMSGTVTGALGRFSSTASTLATVATTDGQYSLRAAGNTKALLVTHDATATTIAGTDQTGFGSFQPLKLYGSSVEAPTPAALDNSTKIATTAFVTAALAGSGASISVGTLPPGSPAANALWWNSDAATGGGQMFIYYDSFWVPASPGVGSGSVVQTVSYQTGAVATGTTLIPFDDTIPQIGEGNEYMTLGVTPRSATSRLLIDVIFVGSNTAISTITVALFQDSTANALAATTQTIAGSNQIATISLRHMMTSGSTGSTTFRIRAGASAAGTTTLNGNSSTRAFGGVLASSIVIQEVL